LSGGHWQPAFFIVSFLLLILWLFVEWQPESLLWLALGAVVGLIIGFLLVRRSAAQHQDGSDELSLNSATVPPLQITPRDLLATVMTNLREGMIVVNDEMRVVGSNPAANLIFSHVESPLEGKRLTELTRNLSVHQAFEVALQDGERNEINIETRGDDKHTFDLRIAPLRFENENEPRTAIGIFYDISELERLEKVRQEFLSNVSHELRTPLTAILAFVETLEDGAVNDAENNLRFLTVIRKNAERMNRLISDTLELSAIEAGKITVEAMEVNLELLIDDIADNLAAKAEAAGVKIINQVPAEATVFADVDRLEQMLTNLIDNAIKFNRTNGSVMINYSSNGERDCIKVADTGEGILPEQAERIFERFYRVDRARTTREIGGTGLGLAIVKHLVRLHGGEANVTSEINKGSTFTIELPKESSI
jgi:two-component system phosphate regulon sensor histidine kinase PhoR